MKIGDLIRWTHFSGETDVGIVSGFLQGEVEIVWSDGVGNGLYSPSNPCLEIISENR